MKLDLEVDVKNYELFELYSSIIHSALLTLKMIDSKSPCNTVSEHQQVFPLLMNHSQVPILIRHGIYHKNIDPQIIRNVILYRIRLPTHDDNYHNSLRNVIKTTLLMFTLTTYFMLPKNVFAASSPSPFLSSPTPYSFMSPMYTHLQQSKSDVTGQIGSSGTLR